MRFRPANIRLINRRQNLPRLLLALSSQKETNNNKTTPQIRSGLTGHSISVFHVQVGVIPRCVLHAAIRSDVPGRVRAAVVRAPFVGPRWQAWLPACGPAPSQSPVAKTHPVPPPDSMRHHLHPAGDGVRLTAQPSPYRWIGSCNHTVCIWILKQTVAHRGSLLQLCAHRSKARGKFPRCCPCCLPICIRARWLTSRGPGRR